MSEHWIVTLDFEHKSPEGTWYDENVVSKDFRFDTEDEAQAFHNAAQDVFHEAELDTSLTGPSSGALAFPRKYNVVVFSQFGEPCGGFLKGEPVGDITLALARVLRVVEQEDITVSWRDDWEWARES